MPPENDQPTSFPAVNALVLDLLTRVRAILGERFIGMYLDGSLASGAFDPASDIDFVVACTDEVNGELFFALQTMHDGLATLDSPYATELEGSYISALALRRHDPALTRHPNLERGPGERLKYAIHDEVWDVHRSVLRERGIVLAGPPPHTLVDPVSPDQLRRAMLSISSGWLADLLNHPEKIQGRGYQSYVVLSICRILYTLQFGQVASKLAAARWAEETFGAGWAACIERAWEGRKHSQVEAQPGDIRQTLDWIRFALGIVQQANLPS